MENAGTAKNFALIRTKILRGAVLTGFVLLVSHANLLEGCFPAATAVVVYMMSRNTSYVYTAIPAVLGIMLCMTQGYDAWGEAASVCICALFFAAAGRVALRLMHRAVIASALQIICTCVYRLAGAELYKISISVLLLDGALVFAFVFAFDIFFKTAGIQRKCAAAGKRRKRKPGDMIRGGGNAGGQTNSGEAGGGECGGNTVKYGKISCEMSLSAFAAVCFLAVCGTGFVPAVWGFAVFLCLWTLVCAGTGQAVFVTVVYGAMTALTAQADWGAMSAMLIAAVGASFAVRLGSTAAAVVFAAVCLVPELNLSEALPSVPLYALLPAAGIFLIVNWRFKGKLAKIMRRFAGRDECTGEYGFKHGAAGEYACGRETKRRAAELLRIRAGEMEKLAELYETYVDTRSALAAQFEMTGQIIDDIRYGIKHGTDAGGKDCGKFALDVASAQWAAGGINGDCCCRQDIGDGRTALIISDGMGKGKKAASESLLVVKTITALLKCGVTAELTLKTINTIMLMRGDGDSFATVDLAIADRISGRCKFYKIGAAPTLIRRKTEVREVRLSAVPLGIVNGLEINCVEVLLKRGDRIIMMSDGVSDGGADSRAPGGFLRCIKKTAGIIQSEDPQSMCDIIMNSAADSYMGKERDDLTVMVARVV